MTQDNIYSELRGARLQENIDSITATLVRCGERSCQRIFAILCLIELPAEIDGFLRKGIHDTDLPFRIENNVLHRAPTKSGRLGKGILSLKPEIWRGMYCDFFDKYQGPVSPPTFKLSWEAKKKVPHSTFDDRTILPFLEMEETYKDGEPDFLANQREGGTSTVRKVKIHPAHYNASSVRVS
jgi:hypothetical protein